MKPYDVELAFAEIEDELIESMIRNMRRHRLEEIDEKKEWMQWQVEQLKALENYKKKNKKKFKRKFGEINDLIEKAIKEARTQGNMDQEIQILEAIKNGFTGYQRADAEVMGEFFKTNDRKLEALIKATKEDFKRGEQAILRMAEDQYRQIVFSAQVYANTGAGTYEKAVDMATKDFLSRGINCIEYANGARHTMKDYADMAIRTAAKRAYLAGEGEKRKEWGISTVIVNKRGNACPKCVPFVGKVLIDDVYSGGSRADGDYPLLSRAMELGLYHPRCKDAHSTYFPGISTADDKWTKKELEAIGEEYKQEQKQMYAQRQAEKFGRLATYSLDPDNKSKYAMKTAEWTGKNQRYTVTEDVKIHRQDTPINMIDLVEKYTADEFVTVDGTAENAFAYDMDLDVVLINPSHPQYPYYEYRETMIHEIAHRIDQSEYGSPMHSDFSNAIAKIGEKIRNNPDEYQPLFDVGGEFEYNMLMSDIFGCITDNVVMGSAYHDSQYIGVPGYMELEVFANIFSILYQGDDKSVDFVKNELREVYQAFLEIIGDRSD